jgi:hypothetical protein
MSYLLTLIIIQKAKIYIKGKTMAIFRKLHLGFWDDSEILEYSPEDKYFMLFLFTNPKTTQCGIYEISIKQMEYYTGYNRDTVKILIDRFENKYKKIKYCVETKEMAIKNWAKYNYSDSPKIKSCIENELKNVKNQDLIEYVYSIDSVYIEYPKKNKNKNKNKEKEKELIESIDRIYKTYPTKCNLRNRYLKTSKNKDKIKTLLKERSEDSLLKLIDEYLSGCKKEKTYLKDFSTFLNNLPDIEDEVDWENLTEKEIDEKIRRGEL